MKGSPNFAYHRAIGELLAIKWRPRLLYLACIALCAFAVFLYPINHDAAWLLSESDQVRRGARLYVDLIEVSPPLIVWLGIPFSFVAQLTGLDIATLYRVGVLLISLASVSVTARLLGASSALRLVILFALVPAAAYDFGQREHLAIVLALPYVAGAIVRLRDDAHLSSRWRLGLALAACVGLLIKPHFLLVPICVESWLLLKRRRCDITLATCACASAVYWAAVWHFAPEYVETARILMRVYAVGLFGISPWAFLIQSNFQFGVASIGIALISSRRAPTATLQALLAAALGFAGSALAQSKGWSYHWYPFAAISWVLLGVTLEQMLRPTVLARLVFGLFMVLAAIAPFKSFSVNPYLPTFAAAVKELGGGPTIVFTNTVRAASPLLTLPGSPNASRLQTLQLLSASILRNEPEIESYIRAVLIEDFVNNRPRIVIVDRQPIGMPPGFDFVTYLAQDPAFRRAFGVYREDRNVGGFTFFVRR